MSLKIVAALLITASAVSVAIGYYLRFIVALGKRRSIEIDLKQIELLAKEREQKIIAEAEEKAEEILKVARAEIKEKEENNKKTEERLIKKDELLDSRQTDIDKEVEGIKKRIEEIRAIRENSEKIEQSKKEELLKTVERQAEEDILVRIRKFEAEGEEKLDRKAKDILATSIHRLAQSVSSDMLTTHVSIASDEIKGKIIGKEGRNIKAFERATGVEVIIDDTPGSITIS